MLTVRSLSRLGPALPRLAAALSTSQRALRLRRRRTLFFGNDAFSLTHLQTLHQLMMSESGLCASLCVTTSSEHTPVFDFARDNGLRTCLWRDLEPSFAAQYDLGVLASFGHMLPAWLLDELPVINVHPSLLPRWRGSAPVVHCILRGDALSGVSIILLEPHHFDRGPLLLQEAMPVAAGISAFALTAQLADLGQRMLTRVLSNLSQAVARQTAQGEEGVRVARRVRLGDAVLDWEGMSGDQVDRLARSVGDLMPLTSRFGGHAVGLKEFVSPRELEELRSVVSLPANVEAGTPVFEKRCKDLVFVKCRRESQEWTAFRRVRIGRSNTSKRWLTALEFHNGYLSKPDYRGVVFESSPNPLFKKTAQTRLTSRAVES